MVHLVVTLRIAAYIAVAVHLGSPLLLCPGKVLARVLRRVRDGGRHVCHLAFCVGVEMRDSPVVPAKHISKVTGAPTGKRHAPTYAAMEPGLAVPIAVGCHHERPAQGVDKRVGSVELNPCGHQSVAFLGRPELRRCLCRGRFGYLNAAYSEIALAACIPLGGDKAVVIGGRGKASGLVGAHVAVAPEAPVGYVAHQGLYLQRLCKALGTELPHRSLAVDERHHIYIKGRIAPRLVFYHISARALRIACLTPFGGLERVFTAIIDGAETHIAVVALLVYGEYGSVACLDAIVGVAPVEGPCVLVLAVDAHEVAPVGAVLERTLGAPLVIIVRT